MNEVGDHALRKRRRQRWLALLAPLLALGLLDLGGEARGQARVGREEEVVDAASEEVHLLERHGE